MGGSVAHAGKNGSNTEFKVERMRKFYPEMVRDVCNGIESFLPFMRLQLKPLATSQHTL